MKKLIILPILISCAGLAPPPEHPDSSICRGMALAACENSIGQSCKTKVYRICLGGLGWQIIDGQWKAPNRCESIPHP